MCLKLIFCFYYFTVLCVSSFNFVPKYAQVFTNNQPGSYFGFSVLLQGGTLNSPPRLIIGAPKANSSFNLHSSLVQPGAVYSCSITNGNCTQFLLDTNGNVQQKTASNQFYVNKKDYGWLGGAIDGQDTAQGQLVACSPRWINQIHKDIYYLQNGLCYLLEDSTNENKRAKSLIPLISQSNQGYLRPNETVYYYALGEAGMSVHFAKNNSELLFGAPGVLQWKGMIGKYDGNLFSDLRVPNPNYISKIEDFAYFGYALSSGKFFNSSPNIWYVGGAPRGHSLSGQVLLFEYGKKPDEFLIHYEMNGEQEGEYFGSALAVGDVNGDGADDVIVGSPMYSIPNYYDIGRVYIYINNMEKKGNFEKTIIQAPSQQAGIRFGTAVSVIGDINIDGFSDIAIGAPYYNGNQGAIFIYLGSPSGISDQYSQKILASDVSIILRGFGSSISRGVDIDNNHYKDLAVGSFLSSHAVILKTRPVLRMYPSLTSNRYQISIDVKDFEITACVRCDGAHLPSKLLIKLILTADDFYKRVYFKYNRASKLEITKEHNYGTSDMLCEKFDIIVVNTQSDFTQPIVFKMTTELMELNDFCETCPVVDKRIPNSATLSIPYETGCKDSICHPKLKLEAKFNTNKQYLIIGEDEKIDVSVSMSNMGEPAFACKFYAEIPLISSFVKIPDMCQNIRDNVLLCDMGNPLRSNELKSLQLPLDVSNFGNNDHLVVKLNITSAGAENDLKDNTLTLEIPLKTEVRISVIGISDPEQFNFIENDKLKQENFTFTHMYTVQNLGPSPLDDLELIFWIPQSFGPNQDHVLQVYRPEATAEGTSIACTTSDPDGFFTSEPTDIPIIIEAEGPASRARRYIQTTLPPIPSDVEELNNLPMDNPAVFTRVQKLVSSDKQIPDGLPANRTLSVGCSVDGEIQCVEVRCVTGVVKRNKRIMVTFRLVANLTFLDEKREEKDTIVITTSVQPTSQYFNVNRTYTHTLLQGNVRQENPLKWIILGLILGIILLCLIVYGLHRTGFFRRKEHEKLMNEKEETFGELTEQTD